MVEMGLTPADIGPVVFDPEISYPADRRKNGDGVTTAQRGALAVGYRVEDGVVVVLTVLHRTQETYVRAQ